MMMSESLPHQFGKVVGSDDGFTKVIKPYNFSKSSTAGKSKSQNAPNKPSGAPPVSKANLNTIEKLKSEKAVPQADVTRLINTLIKTQDKETFNDIANVVFKKEKDKHPNYSDDEVLKELVKRFKGKDSKDFIRQEYIEKIIPSGGDKIKTKKDAEKNPTVMPKKLRGREAFEEMISSRETPSKVDSGKTPSGTGTATVKGVDKSVNVVEETKLVPNKGAGTTLKPTGGKGKTASTTSDFFDTTSNLYAKNKGLVDKVANSFTPENIESGGWFTSLASLAVPEVEIINSLMKFTPAGATAKDYIALEKIKRGEPSGLSDSEEQMLAFKSIVNPDLMGKNWEKGISKVTGDVGDALSTTWNKLTGHSLPDKKTELQVESAEAIAKREATTKKAEDKKRYIDTLMTDPNAKSGSAGKPKFDMPTSFGKTGGSSKAFDPKTGQSIYKPVLTAEQVLTPPDIGSYGWTDPTVMEDISRWFVGAFSPVKAPSNKEEYIQQMKTANPELYARYEKEMGDYNWKLKQSTFTPETTVDVSYDQNKKIVQSIQMTNDTLIKKARSLKQLTTEQAERAYDINESLLAIMDGKAYMTYDDIKKINSRLIESFSPEVKKLALPELQPLYDTIDVLTMSPFKGGSTTKVTPDLLVDASGKVKTDTDMKDRTSTENKYDDEKKQGEEEKEEEDKKQQDETIKKAKDEGQIKEERVEVGQNDKFPRIRPQLAWGDTNNTLMRKDDEYKNSQIYNEMMSINPKGWFQGEQNKLYLSTVAQDEMRYNNTYQLPYKRTEFQPDPRQFNTRQSSADYRQRQSYKVESQNELFNELQRPVMVSQYAPMNGFNNAYNPEDFSQYQQYIIPKEFTTTYPVVQQQIHTNFFPYVTDSETGGIPQKATLNKNDYIVQQRFRK